MTQPIWQKSASANRNQQIEQFMSGDDILLDQILLPYDIKASIAHVKGLASINLVTKTEADKLVYGLEAIADQFNNGTLKLTTQFEDGHSAIEYWLTQMLGEIGKKVHTGRSRNDQVLVATRLYMKDCLKHASKSVSEIAETCLKLAAENSDVVMPGYTHLQRAVPSSLGMWYAAFGEAMIDNLQQLQQCYSLIDCNPLGSAAGYGVNVPLDRDLTTEVLGFSRVQLNPIYCQNSRGKLELAVLNSLSLVMLDVRRLAWDLSLFATQEFAFVSMPDEMTTGSSIMPNKRNPDLVELIRASYAVLQGATGEIQSLLSLPSGYQRDLQFGKGPFLRASEKSLQVLDLIGPLLKATQFDPEKMLAAIEPAMFATDLAIESAVAGIPFRDAYKQSADAIAKLESRDAMQSIKARVSAGGCANLCLNQLDKRFETATNEYPALL